MVRPGDMIVADGDGVLAVPVEHAEAVAAVARGILDSDKRGRRKLYETRGLPPDSTIEE
jgi:regulator of RNase E activity RraA